MNAETKQPGQWQISLANVMVFVFAVGIWFLITVLGSDATLAGLALMTMVCGMIGSVLAWKRNRMATFFLICIFEIVVVVSLPIVAYARASALYTERRRHQQLLQLIDYIDCYHWDLGMFPPPPPDRKQCGEYLAGYLTTKGKEGFPYHDSKYIPKKNGVLTIEGGTGNAVQWELVGTESIAIIDVGNDGVAGRYSFEKHTIQKTPIDANQDGFDDGADDFIILEDWGFSRR